MTTAAQTNANTPQSAEPSRIGFPIRKDSNPIPNKIPPAHPANKDIASGLSHLRNQSWFNATVMIVIAQHELSKNAHMLTMEQTFLIRLRNLNSV